ncbi:MAG: cupin domain-containing protein [Desulfobacterales bacterium]|nr:MAG: cupin domain-containing protein [Desulfobacterales bacterium]
MAKKKSQYCFRIEDLPRVNLTGDEKLASMANLLLSDKMLISFIENPAGCVFPVHSHESEQILIMLEGEEEHVCGDETFLMKAGDVCVHPSNVPHGGQTKTGFKGIDIFCPPRPDHVEKLKKALKEQGAE